MYRVCLLDFIRETYGLEPVGIAPAKRGFYGETWRLDTADHSCFLKLDYSAHQAIYERSFLVMEHLRDHGIDFISRIVKATDGQLCARFDGAVLGVFEWIDGENIETDDTKPPEYQMLARVYAVPAEGLAIPREDFSAERADKFYGQWDWLKRDAKDEAAAWLLAILERDREQLAHRAGRLRYFAQKCQGDTSHFYITHGDAGGNLIVSGDRFAIVDWDEHRLAPPERDAWVMCCQDRPKRDWAQEIFHRELRRNGIGYVLRPERLAYYCYDYFFFYLTEILGGFTQTGIIKQEIEAYFGCWIEECMRYADAIP